MQRRTFKTKPTGRPVGSLARCTCISCGTVEVRTGCTSGFHCIECDPNRADTSLKHRAHQAVAKAIDRGELPRPSEFACVDCGCPAIEYEHRNYYEPLNVEPICRSCNLRRGPAIGSRDRIAPQIFATHRPA